jgi:hypothetical protein
MIAAGIVGGLIGTGFNTCGERTVQAGPVAANAANELICRSLRIVDAGGQTRALLEVRQGTVALEFLGPDSIGRAIIGLFPGDTPEQPQAAFAVTSQGSGPPKRRPMLVPLMVPNTERTRTIKDLQGKNLLLAPGPGQQSWLTGK